LCDDLARGQAKLDKSVLLRVSLLLMSFVLFGLTIFGAKGERPNVPAPWCVGSSFNRPINSFSFQWDSACGPHLMSISMLS
jgi:hypothetical protein